jgi:hypothetical protein
MAAAPLQRWQPRMASACPHTASPPPALELANPSAALQIPVPSLISQNLPPPLGISPCTPQGERMRGGEGEAGREENRKPHWGSPKPSRRWTTRSPSGLQARPPKERGCPCVDRKGAGAVQAAADRLYFLFAELNPCFLCSSTRSASGFAATAPQPSLPRHLSLRPVVTEVNTIPSPCSGPSLRAEAGPSLVSSLFVCCPLPARAAAQTRHCLRAEPVACRCRCRHRRARPFALRSCRSFVSTCVAELRFAAGTHTTEHAPSSQGLAFLRSGVV